MRVRSLCLLLTIRWCVWRYTSPSSPCTNETWINIRHLAATMRIECRALAPTRAHTPPIDYRESVRVFVPVGSCVKFIGLCFPSQSMCVKWALRFAHWQYAHAILLPIIGQGDARCVRERDDVSAVGVCRVDGIWARSSSLFNICINTNLAKSSFAFVSFFGSNTVSNSRINWRKRNTHPIDTWRWNLIFSVSICMNGIGCSG